MVNRAFLRSNNLASRLGIESAATGGIKKDIDTAKGMAVQDETTTEAPQEEAKYKSLLRRKIVDADVLDTAKGKVLSAIRVLKSSLDAKVSKNVTVTPLVAEIKKVMGKQLDIDLKKAMGGKKDGELRKFLLRNKAAILENMTTTYLMTAMPDAIQKQVDGVWTSDWAGKKIDREKVSTDNGNNKFWRFHQIDGDNVILAAGGDVVGDIPQGLPSFKAPVIQWDLLLALLPAALVMALIGFMEATSISKAIATSTGERVDTNKELVGQGLANIAGSFFGSYTVSGSFSRSAVAAPTRAYTPATR